MNVARNIVISGEHEGKKVVLTGDGAGIETKYKGTIPLDHTTVKEYRILWSERKRVRFLGVLLGFIAFLGLFIIGAFIEVTFTMVVLGKDEVAGWFTYGLGGLGMVWCIIKSPFIGVYQIELLFQDGKRSVVEVSGGIYKRMKGKIADCSVPPARDEKEVFVEKKDADILAEIEAINDAIADEKMSEQIDRIRDITKKILDCQEKRPEKAVQLHRFLSYYLPTTLKILKSYSELEEQGVSGGNITETMDRIEGMMDKTVEGFEKQLDQLYQGEAMDIAADVEVLERMMAKDGLTKEEDFSLNQ
ncbi:MAG: 5-bromo-4-chloroindolyl phosphate hydrolysis family protein [Lawsonibacter sp.]